MAAARWAFLVYNLTSEAFLGPELLFWIKEGLHAILYPADACPQFQRALAPFLLDEGLPFAQVLSAEGDNPTTTPRATTPRTTPRGHRGYSWGE